MLANGLIRAYGPLILLVAALGAIPIYAQNITLINVDPASASPGTPVSVTATGFASNAPAPAATVTLSPQGGGTPVSVSGVITGSGVGRSINFIAPGGSGVYNLSVSGSGLTSGNSLTITLTGTPSFLLTPPSGAQGATIQVTISGTNTSFPPGGTSANFGPGISVGGAGEGATGPVAVQPNGTAIATLTINAAAALGARNVTVNGGDTITQAGAFTVTSGTRTITLINVDPTSGPMNTPVSVTATGFQVGVSAPPFTITLTPQGGGAPFNVGAVVTGTNVGRSINFLVPPAAPAGTYSITASASGYVSGNSLPFTITGTPSFSLSPSAGAQGATSQVTITPINTSFPSGASSANFGPGISVGGAAEGATGLIVVQPNGTAIATLAINPGATVGGRTVVVNGIDNIVQANAFTVTSGTRTLTLVNVNPSSTPVSTPVSVTATGFQVGELAPPFTITLTPVGGGAPVTASATVTGTALGRSINFVVPAGTPAGNYNLTAAGTGYVSGNSLPFTVTGPPGFTLTPASGNQGVTVQVTINPLNTTFTAGSTSANFGAGISVGGAAEGATGPVIVQPNGTAIATLIINPAAALGGRSVTVLGGDTITQANAFSVTSGVRTLTLISVNPSSAFANIPVSVTATGFQVGVAAPPFTVTLTPQGGGAPVLVSASVTGTSLGRSINFIVPPGAPVGNYTLTAAGTGYVSGNSLPFTITNPPSFTLNPNSSSRGVTVQVTITGSDTTFPLGATTANFGPGISVGGAAEGGTGPVAVQPNGTAIATLIISSAAALGFRTVTVNGLDTITQANAFTVTSGSTNLTLISVDPSSAPPNAAVSVTATGFQVGVAAPPFTVTLSPQGGGSPIVASAIVTGLALGRSINFTVPPGAPSGLYTLSAAGSGYVSANTLPFTVISQPSFTLAPPSGAQGTNLEVTITPVNTSFPGSTTVNFGPGISVGGVGEGLAGPVAIQPNGTAIASLSINAAAVLGPRAVTVNGSDFISLPNVFAVTSSTRTLTLDSITPPTSPISGNVAIIATGFEAGVATPALIVTLTPLGGGGPINIPTTAPGLTSTRNIPFTVPVGTPLGNYSVTVSAVGYVSGNSLPFTVIATPQITSVNPSSAQQAQTLSVTITGANTNFSNLSTVSLGAGIVINSVTFNSSTSLTANISVQSGAAPGPRDVIVTTDGVPVIGSGLFTVVATPLILSANPTSGQQGQSLPVVIAGQNTAFSAISSVSFGAGVTVDSVVFTNATTLTANIRIDASAAIGSRNITVTTNGTAVTGLNLFTVTQAPARQITSIAPNTGQQGQTLNVVITGAGTTFTPQSTVTLGAGVTVNSVSFVSVTSVNANITIATNATVGPRDVTVTTDGTPVTGSGLFSVTAPPVTILSVTPPSGQQGQQSLQVTIVGANTNFSAQSSVSFGSGVTVTALSIGSATSLTAAINIAPGAVVGPRDVTVTTNGTPVTGSGMFSVTSVGPQLISATPSSGTQGQTLAVTILGSGTSFNAGSTASFGSGITVNSVSINSGTSLTANITIAAGAATGARDVTVTTGGTPLTGPNLFSVVTAGPAILSVNPSSASPGQSLNVKITGVLTHFAQGSSQPSFGPGITVNSVTVANATTLDANITINSNTAPGGRTVTVTTGAETASLENGFFVLPIGQSGPLSCITNTGVPPLLRAEGFTELTGDIILVCTGGVAGQTSAVNIQVFLNTQITSRVINGQSEALLIVDELGANAAPGPITPAIYRAVPAQGDNAVVWANVQVVAPGPTGQRVLRITNVRANATAIGTSTSLIPSQVVAFLSVSPSNSLPLSSPQQIVGFVQPGLVFDLTNCDATVSGSSVTTGQFAQCVGENSAPNRDLIGGTEGNMQFAVRFKEGFQTAFKTQIAEGQLSSVPGVVFNSESGFVRTPDLPYSVGGASAGTRLTARFTNIPSGARLFVTNTPSFGSTPGFGAVLVRTGPNGESGGVQPGVPAAGQGPATLFCPLTAGNGFNATELQVVNGSAIAVWEVTAANPAALESAVFGVAVAYAPNTPSGQPGLGQASVSGNFAPFYAPGSDAGRMSSTLPIPRFIDSPSRVAAFRIDSCVTNLLFPFVTNHAGFDTGIAVANTSRDPFGNALRPQAGVCTINYYGGTPQGGAAPASQKSNTAVEAGSTMTFVLSSGGSHGIAATPGFQGYLIIQCDFRYAHGFAFITDGPIGAARVAEGYLGLVMDNGVASRGSRSETLSH